METIEVYFTDTNLYNDAVSNWNLDYKLLSKSAFSAEIKLIFNE